MISKLKSPLVAAALSLILSTTLGAALCWRAALPIIEQAIKARPKPPAAKADKGWDFWTIEIDNLSNDLKEERARLKKQSDVLDQRASRLAAEEKELERVRSDIEAMRKQVGDAVTEIAADESKNIRTLAQTYTSLSPKAVVAIFREMDDVTAVKILSQMKPDVVGPIFEEMAKSSDNDVPLARRAAILSEKLRLMKASKQATQS
jgi:flagellar motility protein MotE (MotC chaperone)